jgi:cytochrome c oxidase cbb3-type subunit 3
MTPAPLPLRRTRRVSGLLLAAFLIATRLTGATAAPSADAEAGRKLFRDLCSNCHGHEGAGAMAPSLQRPRLTYAPDEATLRVVIADGIGGRGMPRVRRWSEKELRELVAYVQWLGAVPATPLPGDPAKGREVFNRVGCVTCHVVNGQGGTLGPELTTIGRMRGAEYLREAIVNPGAVLPKGTLPVPGRGYDEFLPVVAVTRTGREIKGVRLNEDLLTIQIRDEQSQFHSLRKSDLTRLQKLSGTSVMPNLSAQLAPGELDHLVAYLASLQGQP